MRFVADLSKPRAQVGALDDITRALHTLFACKSSKSSLSSQPSTNENAVTINTQQDPKITLWNPMRVGGKRLHG